jgi:predicted hydrocarbon binding protein
VGELLDAGMRMCLLDVETSFYGLRKSVEGVVGPAAAFMFYESGFRGGAHYAEARLKSGRLTRDESGFRHAIREYSEGGFGSYQIRELDFAHGTAVITCQDPMAFEAYAVVSNGERRPHPVCDFSRGVLAGLLGGIAGLKDLGGFEETCRAAGAAECVFRIGLDETMRRASVAHKLARPTPRS